MNQNDSKNNRRKNINNPGISERNNGQPYYDENGILRNVPGFGEERNSGSPSDPYEQMYKQQLSEYEKMSGENDLDGDVDLEFHPMSESYGDNRNRQRQSQSGAPGQRRNPQQRPAQNNSAGRKPVQKSSQKSKSSQAQKKNSSNSSGKKQNSSKKNNSLQFGSNNSQKGRNSKKVKEKNRHPIKTFFKVLIIIIIVLFILLNIMMWHYIGMVNIKEKGTRTVTNASIKDSSVRNILLIGSDTRETDKNGRTDTIILLSINKKSKEITMTSIMRDTYVEIVGKTTNGENIDQYGKINSAYVYGGAELLMDTIEHNFDVAVDDYMYVDFTAFIDIVDSVGGIELEISDEEAEGMIPQTMEVNDILKRKHDADILTKGGKLNLNGYQALAYARLRYVGNADFERTERQRTVITKVIEKLKSNPLKFNSFAKAAAGNISTNMSKLDMYFLCYKVLFSMNYDIKSLRLPADGDYTYGSHNGESTLDVDFQKCRDLIKSNIYKQ